MEYLMLMFIITFITLIVMIIDEGEEKKHDSVILNTYIQDEDLLTIACCVIQNTMVTCENMHLDITPFNNGKNLQFVIYDFSQSYATAMSNACKRYTSIVECSEYNCFIAHNPENTLKITLQLDPNSHILEGCISQMEVY